MRTRHVVLSMILPVIFIIKSITLLRLLENILVNILRLHRMIFCFSTIFGVCWVLVLEPVSRH